MFGLNGIDKAFLIFDVSGLLLLIGVALYLRREFLRNSQLDKAHRYGKFADSPIVQYLNWSISLCVKQFKTNGAFISYLVATRFIFHTSLRWADYCFTIGIVALTSFRLSKRVFEELNARSAMRPGFVFLALSAIILVGPLVRVFNDSVNTGWDIVSWRWETTFLLIYPSAAAVWLLTATNRIMFR